MLLGTFASRRFCVTLGGLLHQQHARLGDAVLTCQAPYADSGAFPELLRAKRSGPMKPRASLYLLALLVAPWAPALVAQTWQVVGTGVEYAEFNLPDPNNGFVARMDRANLSVTIERSHLFR